MKDFKDRVYVVKSTGRVYGVPKPCCIICSHCSDIFVDYTNGPYAAICGIHKTSENFCCDDFEVDDDAYMLAEDFMRMTNEERDAYIRKKILEEA